MRRFSLLTTFLLLTNAVFGQFGQPAPSVPFASYKTAAQISALRCTRIGTLVFDTTNGVWKYCSATGNPGTWSSLGGGGTGLLELNGLTTDPQNFAVGTSGTNFNIVSSGSTHTFNLPDASGTNRGLLTSADWTSFNSRLLNSNNLSDLTDASAARTNLGLVIGTDVQAFNSDLDAIAGLSPTDGDIIQRTSGAWTTRSMAQLKTSLALDKSDVGLGNVDNTSDATKWAASATLTNKTLISPVINVTSDAEGDIYYRNGSGLFTRLGIGTDGQVLTVSSGLPSWEDAAGGGATSPLTLTASSAPEIPLSLVAASGQTANLFNVTSNGGSAGDLFNIASDGTLFVRRSNSGCSVQALGTSGGTTQCIRFGASSFYDFLLSNASAFRISATGAQVASDDQYSFNSSTANNSSNDTGIARTAAGVVKITNASTGEGSLLFKQLVTLKTTAYSVTEGETNSLFTNEGATASVTFTLPSAASGLQYRFCVQDADGITVTANTGDTIRIETSVTAAAGSITSTAIGSCVALTAINATEWFAVSSTGTWTF